MKQIVKNDHGEAKVSIQDLADYSKTSYRLIKDSITRNQVYFEKLGLAVPKEVTFQTLLLNEPQSTFLVTLLRNTKEVTKFKFDLVVQFYKMREIITNQICNTHEKKEIKLNAKIEHQKELIKEGRKYGAERGGEYETAFWIRNKLELDLPVSELNDILVEEGLILEEDVTTTKHIPNNVNSFESKNAIVINVDDVREIMTQYGIKQKVDRQLVFDYEA